MRPAMNDITEKRKASSRQEPNRRLDLQESPGHKAWQLIDAAGCRGLTIGAAQVSELHCNFLINLGGATANDIETLGETCGGGSRKPPALISNGRSSGSAWPPSIPLAKYSSPFESVAHKLRRF